MRTIAKAFVALMLLVGSAVAEAVDRPVASTGPVRLDPSDTHECIALNTSAKIIKFMGVEMSYTDADGILLPVTSARYCDNVEPGGACPGSQLGNVIGPSVRVMYCNIVSRGSRDVRGALCNLTKGLCSDAR